MRLQPIVYTGDMDRAVEWYSRVLGREPVDRSEAWTAFEVGDAALGIHAAADLPRGSRVGLSLIVTEPLEGIVARLEGWGIAAERGIVAQPFGRSMLLRDPDGSPVQVNEHADG